MLCQQSEELWSLIQVACHPHTQSLYNIIKQLSIQNAAIHGFHIVRSETPSLGLVTANKTPENAASLNQVGGVIGHVILQ